jgi:hypothetical protein
MIDCHWQSFSAINNQERAIVYVQDCRASLPLMQHTPHRNHHQVVISACMIDAEEDIMESDPEFLLRRAKEESVRAIEAEQPEAANVHQKLAVQYSAKAAMALANGVEDHPTVISGGVIKAD